MDFKIMGINIPYKYDTKTQWMYYSVLNWLRDSGFKDVYSVEFQSNVIYITIEKRSQWYGEFVAVNEGEATGINYVKDKIKDGSKLEIEIHNKTVYCKNGKIVEENRYWVDIGYYNSEAGKYDENFWDRVETFRFDEDALHENKSHEDKSHEDKFHGYKVASETDLKVLKRMKEKLNGVVDKIFGDWRG